MQDIFKENSDEFEETKGKINWFKEIISWVMVFIIAYVVAYVVSHFVIINANIPSGSMKYTINEGDKVLGNRLAYKFSEPKRGDIIIFWAPIKEKKYYIKRLIGLPGDKIVIKNCKLYINGKEIKEDYITPGNWTKEYESYEITVPEGEYFMMGDNRDRSNDSRYWGTIKKDAMVAKAICKYKIWKPYVKFLK